VTTWCARRTRRLKPPAEARRGSRRCHLRDDAVMVAGSHMARQLGPSTQGLGRTRWQIELSPRRRLGNEVAWRVCGSRFRGCCMHVNAVAFFPAGGADDVATVSRRRLVDRVGLSRQHGAPRGRRSAARREMLAVLHAALPRESQQRRCSARVCPPRRAHYVFAFYVVSRQAGAERGPLAPSGRRLNVTLYDTIRYVHLLNPRTVMYS